MSTQINIQVNTRVNISMSTRINKYTSKYTSKYTGMYINEYKSKYMNKYTGKYTGIYVQSSFEYSFRSCHPNRGTGCIFQRFFQKNFARDTRVIVTTTVLLGKNQCDYNQHTLIIQTKKIFSLSFFYIPIKTTATCKDNITWTATVKPASGLNN